MSLAERRLAVKAELDKAKRAHRSTRALQREFEKFYDYDKKCIRPLTDSTKNCNI